MSDGAGAAKITFVWDTPRKLAVVLPGFLMLSLLAHISTFFLFQIVYPERVTITKPPPTVSVLDPSRPEHQALLRLIEAEDPAPAASVQPVVPPALLNVPYRPSYSTVRTLPKTLAEPAVSAQYPPPRDPVTIIRSAAPVAAVTAPATAASVTRLTFSDALAARKLVRTAPIAFQAQRATTPLEPARFLIGVTDRGEVRFVFLQNSCGDLATDEAAAAHLTQLSFAPDEAPITWAHATFTWGDDVYPAKKPKSP